MLPNPYLTKITNLDLQCDVCKKSAKRNKSTYLLHHNSSSAWSVCDKHANTIRRVLILSGYKETDIDQ